MVSSSRPDRGVRIATTGGAREEKGVGEGKWAKKKLS